MLALLRAHGEGQHRARLGRVVSRLHAFLLANFAVITAAAALAGGPGATEHLAVAGIEIVAAGLAFMLGSRPWMLAVLAPAIPLALASSVADASDLADGLALAAFCLTAAVTLRAWQHVPLLLAAGAAYAAGALTLLPSWGVNGVSTVVVAVGQTLVAGAFLAILRRSAAALDAAEWETRAGLGRLVEAEQRERVIDEARRVLHDEVLTALRAVHDGDAPSRGARQGCAAAAAAVERVCHDAEPLESEVGSADAHGLADAIRAGAPVDVEVDLSVADPEARIDAARWQAAARAANEAIRNAHRHAGVSRCRVQVTQGDGHLVVAVSDNGAGITPGAPEGVGIRESIRRPVMEAGGHVQITSGPHGTTVRIEFGSSDRSRTDALLERNYHLTMAAGGQRTLAWSTMLPFIGIWVVVGGMHLPRAPDPLSQAGLLIAVSLLALTVAARIASGPPTTRWVVFVAATLVLLQVWAMTSLPAGGAQDYRNWSNGYLGSVMVVLLFALPAWWGGLVIASQVAVVLVAVAADPVIAAGAFPLGAVNAVAAIPLVTLMMGLLLRRNGRLVDSERSQLREVESRLVRRRLRGEVTSLHLEHTRRVVVPWLRRFASGDVDADCAREQARLLALEARDDLHAPGFYDPDLREAVTRYRAQGGVVDIRPGFSPGAHDRPTGEALGALITRLPPTHRIRLSPADFADLDGSDGPGDGADNSHGPAARLVLLPGCPDDALGVPLGLGGAIVERDEFSLVLRVPDRRVQAPGSPRSRPDRREGRDE